MQTNSGHQFHIPKKKTLPISTCVRKQFASYSWQNNVVTYFHQLSWLISFSIVLTACSCVWWVDLQMTSTFYHMQTIPTEDRGETSRCQQFSINMWAEIVCDVSACFATSSYRRPLLRFHSTWSAVASGTCTTGSQSTNVVHAWWSFGMFQPCCATCSQ
jgi:hypothetical protein